MSTEVLTPEESAKMAVVSTVAVDRVRLIAFEAEWQENLSDLLEKVKEHPLLVSPQQEQWGADQLTRAASALAQHEEERKLLVRPLIDDKKDIDDAYAKSSKPLGLLMLELKGLLGRSAKARLEAVAALEANVAAKAAAGDDEGCQKALAAIPEAVKLSGASTVLKWEGYVVDLSKVPTHLLTINEKALAALCKAHDAAGTTPEVPGIKFQRGAHVRRTKGKS